jgi:hypothetical protein
MTTTEKAAAALEPLAYLLEQAERFRVLKELAAEGMDDVTAGRVLEWNFQDFLREARRPR